jgi:lipid-binding SYLF domain-containing protein
MNLRKIVLRVSWTSPLRILIPLLAIAAVAATTSWAADDTKSDAVGRLEKAGTTLREVTAAPDKGIPNEVFEGAKCIAVVPNLTKAGFILGGEHGKGVATCRVSGGGWSTPAFFTMTGGSWGAQIGVEDVNLVIMIMNDEGMKNLLNSKFKIGADASASAGPVGRHASAGTDWKLETQMLTYSRSKGLFAGIDLGGTVVDRDKETTAAFYGKDMTNTEILTGKVRPPAEARAFLNEVSRVKTEAKEENH